MKLIINGAGGRMGKIIASMAGSENIAALVDVAFSEGYKSLDDFMGEADCVIDFSNHKSAPEIMTYCMKRKLPALIATTGHTPEELSVIHEAAKNIPVFMSPNMSIGVALMADIAERVARVFGECDIELIEAHHDQKLDVPSGTALMLAKRLQEARENLTFNIGRHENGKRDTNELGIHSLRYGSEVGTHEIIFSNGLETITIKHDAKDRALFARGALSVAEWLVKQKPGFYGMRDFIS